MRILRFIGTLIFRIDRCITSFELNFAHYRMRLINEELMTSADVNFQEVFTRKSNIQVEIKQIRDDLRAADEVIERMS